eukprot:scaffold442242_cov16-Prasinocladus_malaysianus.AAC.1
MARANRPTSAYHARLTARRGRSMCGLKGIAISTTANAGDSESSACSYSAPPVERLCFCLPGASKYTFILLCRVSTSAYGTWVPTGRIATSWARRPSSLSSAWSARHSLASTFRPGLKAYASTATISARRRTFAFSYMALEASRASATAKRSQMVPAAAPLRASSA